MNKIELLPKDLHVNNKDYQLGMWVTAFARLCIGYRHIFDKKDTLFSVCVEPEHKPVSIAETKGWFLNNGIGNAVSVDDACDEILNYIELNGYSVETKETGYGESEDEKIRKDIINGLKTARFPSIESAEKVAEWISWLEKQGQKLNDKPVPKFKVGDWVVKSDTVAQILDIQEQYYIGLDTEGNDFTSSKFLSNDKIHLWTIQDAKDGDVLCTYECEEPKIVFILKGTPKKHYALSYYCYYNIMYPHFDDGNKPGCLAPEDSDVKPATKEQRDLLFQKMKEAGYEWDSEMKELKKINKNTDVGHEYFSDLLEKDDCDNINDYAYQVAYCMSHDWMKDTATWDDVERACKLGAEWNERHCKSIWGDGDVYNSKLILSTISQDQDLSLETKDKLTSWFKSLKPQNHWKPSNGQMEALQYVFQHYTPNVLDSLAWDSIKTLELMYQDLKKLKA